MSNINFRNPAWNSFGTIDCEIEHPVFGWIPFTADPNDVESHGQAIFNAAAPIAEPYIPPSPEEQAAQALAQERNNMVCSRMQAKIAMYQAGILEAVESVISQADPLVQIAWNEAIEFRRNSPTIISLANTIDPPLTETQLDDLFRAAMEITV
jgi:hypothetical protein